MQDSENLAIGVLSITATILLAAVILATTTQDQAYAFGDTDRGGDYIMVAGQFSDTTGLVYVTDAAANRLNVYGYDRSQRLLRLWDSHDLRRVFGEVRP